MPKSWERGKNWNVADRIERIGEGKRRQAERVQALLATLHTVQTASHLSRRGISTATAVRFASTSAPSDWNSADRARPIIDAILDSIEDGADRAILAWPARPGSGFSAAAVAMREARSSGRLAYATLAFWPWRNGATWATRSVLVHPEDIARAAARAATDIENRAVWTQQNLAHGSLCLLELRLRDLMKTSKPVGDEKLVSRSNIIVRSPTLLETTCVFAPAGGAKRTTYNCDSEQVLRRVSDYTHLGDKNAGLEGHIAAVGDPNKTPFALFGLPVVAKPDQLLSCLRFPRFATKSLDVLIVDLTRTGRSELPDDWEGRLTAVLQALEHVSGRRPPVVVLSEDAFAMRKAVRALRTNNAALRPARRAPLEVGAYLREPGLFGPLSVLPEKVAPIAFEADIKDASLELSRVSRRLVRLSHAAMA